MKRTAEQDIHICTYIWLVCIWIQGYGYKNKNFSHLIFRSWIDGKMISSREGFRMFFKKIKKKLNINYLTFLSKFTGKIAGRIFLDCWTNIYIEYPSTPSFLFLPPKNISRPFLTPSVEDFWTFCKGCSCGNKWLFTIFLMIAESA